MRDHERIEELLALEALEALDARAAEALARELAGHGPSCPECHRLRREYGDVGGRLAFALEPMPVPEEIVEEILRSREEAPFVPVPRRRSVGRALLGAAAAVVLFVVAAAGGYLLGVRQGPDALALAEFLSRPDVQVVRFDGTGGDLAAAVAPGAGGYLFGSNLAPLPEDRLYALWMIRRGSAVRGACLIPEHGSLLAPVDIDVTGAELLAVTVESTACPSQPTSDPILTAPLRTG